MTGMVAASQGVSITTWLAVAAVIIDSIVTCVVGWRLNKTARRETAKAAETVKPALNDALNNAVVTLLPVLVNTVKQHLGEKGETQSIASDHSTSPMVLLRSQQEGTTTQPGNQ